MRGIAHDVNNVLSIVLNQVDLLEASSPDDPGFSQRVRTVREAVAHGEALTRRLLDLGREDGDETVDVNGVVEAMTEILRDGLGRHVRFILDLRADPSSAAMPQRDLERVVLNLVANAIEAMPDGGQLRVCTDVEVLPDDAGRAYAPDRSGRFVLLQVADTGRGMDHVTRRLAFEPFFSAKTTGAGHGVGLQTCRQIAVENGGWIDVDTVPDGGSTFTVHLPVAAGLRIESGATRDPIVAPPYRPEPTPGRRRWREVWHRLRR